MEINVLDGEQSMILHLVYYCTYAMRHVLFSQQQR